MQQAITFSIDGIEAAPQGSKAPIGRRRDGRTILVESSKRVAPFRQAVRLAAMATGLPLHAGPVRVVAVFRFPRPAGHYGKRGLKPSAPAHLTSKARGDIDKLSRALLDGLTGSLLADDSQVVGLTAEKVYGRAGEQPSTLVTVIPLAP